MIKEYLLRPGKFEYKFILLKITDLERQEIKKWLFENMEGYNKDYIYWSLTRNGKYNDYYPEIYFNNENNALAFKLRWS